VKAGDRERNRKIANKHEIPLMSVKEKRDQKALPREYKAKKANSEYPSVYNWLKKNEPDLKRQKTEDESNDKESKQ